MKLMLYTQQILRKIRIMYFTSKSLFFLKKLILSETQAWQINFGNEWYDVNNSFRK